MILSHTQNAFTKVLCNSPFPHKSVNLFLTLVMIEDELTDLCGNRLLKNEFNSLVVQASHATDTAVTLSWRPPDKVPEGSVIVCVGGAEPLNAFP